MTTLHRVRIILNINRNITSAVLGRAHSVKNGMAKQPALYSAPAPSLIILGAQIVKVETAEQIAATRVKGAAAARNVERAILVGMLETERMYVQTLCDADPEKAVAIAEGAGMVVASTPVHVNPLLRVTLGTQSGTVNLDANATVLAGKSGKKACFNWQWTGDGGKTFVTAPSTPLAKTTIGSLPLLTMAGFRVSVTDAKGAGEWSQVVSILVQ